MTMVSLAARRIKKKPRIWLTVSPTRVHITREEPWVSTPEVPSHTIDSEVHVLYSDYIVILTLSPLLQALLHDHCFDVIKYWFFCYDDNLLFGYCTKTDDPLVYQAYYFKAIKKNQTVNRFYNIVLCTLQCYITTADHEFHPH